MYTVTINSEVVAKRLVYNHNKKMAAITDLIKKDIAGKLYDCVLAAPIKKIEWINKKDIVRITQEKEIGLFVFFLKYDHLKEIDYFYWENFKFFEKASRSYPTVVAMLDYIFDQRIQKSIRRAYLKSYLLSMQSGGYNPKADYVFARVIEDRNHLLKLIAIETKTKNKVFRELRVRDTLKFLNFLKRHYHEKTLTRLWANRNLNDRDIDTIRDTIQMFSRLPENILEENFRKVQVSFRALHDELIRINSLYMVHLKDRVDFDYQQGDLMAQVQVDNFSFRLPSDALILNQWSQQLHNCMFGYSEDIYKKRSIIYGVFLDGRLTYAIEIRGNKIVQALGARNKRIDTVSMDKIKRWFKETYIVEWIQSA
jgi:hypothetical protein